MRATKKTSKKNIAGKIFLSLEMNFSDCFFLSHKLTVFFRNQQQSNARAGWKKKHMFFFWYCAA